MSQDIGTQTVAFGDGIPTAMTQPEGSPESPCRAHHDCGHRSMTAAAIIGSSANKDTGLQDYLMTNYGNPVFTCDNSVVEAYRNRQDLPDSNYWRQGYPYKRPHPLFRTTNSEYGKLPPTSETMPVTYHPLSSKYMDHLAACGMYRNRALNTAVNRN